MPATILPPMLAERLSAVAADVKRVRFLRAISLFALIVVGSALLAILADYLFELSRAGRSVLLVAWLLGVVVAFWRVVLRAMRRPVNRAELAAVVERHYPTLAERLSTLVDLSEQTDASHGSKALIQQLAKETAQRTKRLNFSRAVPTWKAFRQAGIAAAIVLLVISPVLYLTGATERIRRFALPWYSPTVATPFKVTVTSGNPVVKRGDSVTMAGYLERTKDDAILPETATLIYKETGTDGEKKLPMAGDDKAVFSVTKPGVKENFTYCMEAGGARSEWYTVTASDPVDLADGTTITLTAPEYARVSLPVKTIPGFGEFEGLEQSTAALEIHFNRPAVNATLEWKPANKPNNSGYQRIPFLIADDRQSAVSRMILREEGIFRLTLIGEHDLKSELTIAARVTKDTPPTFEKVSGLTDRPLEVRPTERLPLDMTVSDDFAISKLQLEYTIGSPDGAPRVEPIPLPHNASASVTIKTIVALKDKARDGEVVYLRVRAFDNRNIPEEKLVSQETVFPPSGWTKVTLTEKAKPLAEQQVNGQRDKINEKLAEAVADLKEAAKEVTLTKQDSEGKTNLTEDQHARLSNAEAKAKEAQTALDDAAREAAVAPGLKPIANEAKRINEDNVKTAEGETRKAGAEPKLKDRSQQLQAAFEQFETAAKQTEKLIEKNNELAKARLEPKKFEELAAEQAKLASEATQPNADPKKITEQQKKLEEELAKAIQETESLQAAKSEAERNAAQRRAEEAAKLKDDHDQLAAARAVTEKAANQDRMGQLAEKQRKLANDAAGLAEKTKTAATAAQAEGLDRKPFDKAANDLQAEKPVDALTEQEKAARELERLADEIEKAAVSRKDPQVAAKQLARWQQDLSKRVDEFTKNDTFEKLPQHVKDRIKAEQDALAKAVSKLSTPAKDAAAQAAKTKAMEKLAKAQEAVAKSDGDPSQAMKDAGKAIDELAKAMPDRTKRLQTARAELNKIRDEQATVTRQAEEALKPMDKTGATPEARDMLAKKLANTEKKQADLAQRISELDLPGLEPRQKKAENAARNVQEDMQKGYAQDLSGSQKDLTRQLERLREEIDGQTPADTMAGKLAKQQRELATETAKLGGAPLPQDLEKLQRLQRDINKNLANLNTPEAPELGNKAKDAATEAEKAMRNPQDVDELKKKTKDAAEKLDTLADRMTGAESEADRVERLQKNRQAAAEKANQNQGKPVDPTASAEAGKQVQREMEELDQTRAGAAQGAKKKASEELQKLKALADPDRQKAQQQAAADALAELNKQMKSNGDRTAKADRDAQPQSNGEPTPDSKSQDTPGLPTKEQAQAARELAKEQRAMRDETAKATGQNSNAAKAGNAQELAKLEQEQKALAQKAADKAKGAPAGSPAQKAAQAAEKAAGQMANGNPGAAKAEADKAAQVMKETPGGQDLAKEQSALAQRMGEQANQTAGATARQAQREGELAQRAGKLAEELNQAGADAKPAAQAAQEAQRQLERAGRESAAGRGQNAKEARGKAEEAIKNLKEQTKEMAANTPMGEGKPNDSAKAALDAASEAKGAMKEAQKDLKQGEGKNAQGNMKKAEDALNKAAEKLSPDNDPANAKGGPPGGKNPGGNDGSGQLPTSEQLPPDLQQYAGKPWGDLPGEVQSRIIQDLKSKYGEDYARAIKLYFLDVAERK